ncbi:MAG: protein kinase [Eubacterium sp.]|nr:protein kinase [Eubacterium sp.]
MIEQGTILDNTYQIIKPIGSGGGGEIYLADHLRLEKTVVIKKIKDSVKGLIADRGEADVLKNLRHPYLPQITDYFIENNQVYTVMEYIEGESFQQLLEAGRKFAAKDIVKWGTQLSEVLAYLHSQKPPIIHRDIKPANIMLTPEGDIRLIDFNVSLGQEEYVGVLAHSDGYSPVEQYGIMRGENRSFAGERDGVRIEGTARLGRTAQGGENGTETQLLMDSGDETAILRGEQDDETELLCYDSGETGNERRGEDNAQFSISSMERKYTRLPMVNEQSDIYSLGATLYHMITGKRPRKATEQVIPLSECCDHASDGLIYIIDKAMQKDPDKRFRTADKMHDAFVNIRKLDHEYVSYALKRDVLFGIVIIAACCSIICTVLGYKMMRTEEYNTYVQQIEVANGYVQQGQMEQACEVCERAVEMRPEDLAAYVELVHIYYVWQKYEEGIERVEQLEVDTGGLTEETGAQWAALQFLSGECYMELGAFASAADCYQNAIAFQPEMGEYYTRCAIALARAGSPEEAETFLEEALQRGINDAVLYLTKAEIMLSEGQYTEAETLIYQALEMAQDSDISYHAYLTAAKLYEDGAEEIDNAAEKEKELLEAAVRDLENSYALSLSEKLGDVYYELARQERDVAQAKTYYENALVCFTDIFQSGYQNFHVMQNMAVINQMLEDYEEAEKILLDMIEIYPENYRGYMYLALLYTEIQNKISIEKRDYSAIFTYYDKAETLYQRELNNGEGIDVNMQILGNMIEDFRKLSD